MPANIFPLVPAPMPPAWLSAMVLGLAVGLPLAIFGFALFLQTSDSPTRRKNLIGGGLSLLIGVAVAGFLGFIVWSSQNTVFEVTPKELSIRGDIYGREIALADLDIANAKRVDLSQNPGLRPVSRTNGTAYAGYASGWFRLQNGQSALVFWTDNGKLVYLPTRQNFALLISPEDPDAFLKALRAQAASAAPATP